ncbi:hypothetical protein E3N88_29464 [Mikania micrantha]|uniref:Uncharacterized protein n=1 Tax=Mikania micrantha TaxID=192012 RepID=A0A5N6MIV8_9ASTR|nr:hypothetical protein E3N88_29464 [Mikania micrantha]
MTAIGQVPVKDAENPNFHPNDDDGFRLVSGDPQPPHLPTRQRLGLSHPFPGRSSSDEQETTTEGGGGGAWMTVVCDGNDKGHKPNCFGSFCGLRFRVQELVIRTLCIFIDVNQLRSKKAVKDAENPNFHPNDDGGFRLVSGHPQPPHLPSRQRLGLSHPFPGRSSSDEQETTTDGGGGVWMTVVCDGNDKGHKPNCFGSF